MNQAAVHPISLGQLMFIKVHVSAIAGHVIEEGVPTAQPTNTLDIRTIDAKTGQYQAVMTTVVNPDRNKNSPYQIDIECLALLHADDTLNEEAAIKGVTITAHSVLFGAIRETIAWLTGRQPYGPLLLGLTVLQSPERPKEE